MNDSTAAPALAPAEQDALRALIKSHCGLRLEGFKLDYALQRAWPALGVRDGAHLLRELATPGSGLWATLLPHLTVNETYFLREPRQLADFSERALPGLRHRAARRGAPTLEVLSAACSTGEEPYTLAILLAEAGARARVTGLDIDPQAIARAEAGLFGPNAFRGVDDAWRERHFTPAGAQWAIREPYRHVTRFKRQNLLQLEPALAGARFDAIFCRNVLIYFDRPTQLAVIRQLGRLLVAGGCLFLGHSEMFFGEDLGLEVHATDRATMYQRKEAP